MGAGRGAAGHLAAVSWGRSALGLGETLGRHALRSLPMEWRSSHIRHRAGVSEPPASPVGVASAGFSCIIPFRDAPPAQDSPVIS